MAAEKDQKYYFVFVHEDGDGLARISEILERDRIRASVDEVYNLYDVNKALYKVASGGLKGKVVIRI